MSTRIARRSSSCAPHLRVLACAAAAVTAVAVVSGCGSRGPSTKAEVCDSFSQVGAQLLQGNGIIGNPLFHSVKDLGSTAQRFASDASVVSDGQKLSELGGKNTLSGEDLRNASINLANLCGHPLGFG
jgi:hypothetical protein